MNFINENPVLRVLSILLCFLAGLVLVFTGWMKTGEMSGLIQMLIGVGVLLLALAIYNHPFRDKKQNAKVGVENYE